MCIHMFILLILILHVVAVATTVNVYTRTCPNFRPYFEIQLCGGSLFVLCHSYCSKHCNSNCTTPWTTLLIRVITPTFLFFTMVSVTSELTPYLVCGNLCVGTSVPVRVLSSTCLGATKSMPPVSGLYSNRKCLLALKPVSHSCLRPGCCILFCSWAKNNEGLRRPRQ